MNHLSVSEDNKVLLAGKQFVHIFTTKYKNSTRSPSPLRSPHSAPKNLTTLDMSLYFPESSKVPHEKVAVVCCQLSHDGYFLCVADSEKNIYIFDRLEYIWDLYTTFETEKRVLAVQFDLERKHLVMTDKCGDVYVSVLSNPETAKKCHKILGHCSLILDTALSSNNKHIFTADRDEKIRCSKFPEAHHIEYFLMGHKTAVANIGLINEDQNLLSISADGDIKLWTLADQRCLKTWNVFTVCHGIKYVKPVEHDVKRMKSTNVFGNVFFAVVISGTKEIPVFELKMQDLQIRQLGQVKMDSDYCDMAWSGNALFTYNPSLPAVIKRFTVSSAGVLCDSLFSIPRISDFHHDFNDLVAFNQTAVPLRKRISDDSIKSEDLQTRMEEYKAEAEKKIPRIVRGSRSTSATGSRIIHTVDGAEIEQASTSSSEPKETINPPKESKPDDEQ